MVKKVRTMWRIIYDPPKDSWFFKEPVQTSQGFYYRDKNKYPSVVMKDIISQNAAGREFGRLTAPNIEWYSIESYVSP